MAALQQEKITIQLARLGGSKDPFEIDLYWTVNDLLNTVSTKCEIPKENLKLLCKGKMLNEKIGNKTLKSIKIKPNDKLIVMVKKVKTKRNQNKPEPSNSNSNPTNTNNNPFNGATTTSQPENKNNIDDVLTHKKNLQEIKAAAEKLAQRDNDGYDWNANYFLELTNQYGNKIHLPDNQRQALTVGLTLHQKGKKFMENKNYKDAVYIMNLAFESFSKVDQTFLQAVDNYGLLALDIVWCYYLDKDEQNLSNAGKWLQIAEYGLQRAHGKNMERLKQIRSAQNMSAVTGDFIPELSLYVRLNILRALQSFYTGDLGSAQTNLMKAEMDMRKLQISDIDLVKLESMGFHHKESKRALRFCNGNIDQSINHIYNKRDEAQRKRDEERRRQEERALQRKYGATKTGKFVDLKLLKQLQDMGVEMEIAIEALRQTDNAGDDTLNLCTDPERKEVLTQTLYARYFNDKFYWKVEQILGVLGSNNVSESRCRAALFLSFNDVDESVNMLSAPSPREVVDLDRVEARFIPYVQKRQERILKEALRAEKLRKLREAQEAEEKRRYDEEMAKMKEQNSGMNVDGNTDNEAQNGDGDEVEMEDENETMDDKGMVIDDGDEQDKKLDEIVDDDLKRDENGNVVDPVDIKTKAMPNPNLGDVNENNNEDDIMNNLVDKFKPIQQMLPNEDDMQIEQHILDDLDNDDEGYLDIDLTNEQNALENLKGLLTSMQINANAQDSQQSFLSLFKK